ncbi:MAG: hypothetical protein ACRCYO_15130 [Bacteroidia bacterium]
MKSPKTEYITSDEVLLKYPCLQARFNWNITSAGTLHSLGILHGKYLRGKRMLLISVESLKKLIKYYKDDIEESRHLFDDI